MPDDDVAGQSAGVVGTAAFGADDQVGKSHGDAGGVFEDAKRLFDPFKAVLDGRDGSALLLDKEPVRRLSFLGRNFGQPFRLHVLAAESDSQHGTDVWMTDQRDDLADGILIVRAAIKADELDIGTAGTGDQLPGDKFRAFHGIDDQYPVANAFFTIGPGKAGPDGIILLTHTLYPLERRCSHQDDCCAHRNCCTSGADAPTCRAQSPLWRGQWGHRT